MNIKHERIGKTWRIVAANNKKTYNNVCFKYRKSRSWWSFCVSRPPSEWELICGRDSSIDWHWEYNIRVMDNYKALSARHQVFRIFYIVANILWIGCCCCVPSGLKRTCEGRGEIKIKSANFTLFPSIDDDQSVHAKTDGLNGKGWGLRSTTQVALF